MCSHVRISVSLLVSPTYQLPTCVVSTSAYLRVHTPRFFCTYPGSFCTHPTHPTTNYRPRPSYHHTRGVERVVGLEVGGTRQIWWKPYLPHNQAIHWAGLHTLGHTVSRSFQQYRTPESTTNTPVRVEIGGVVPRLNTKKSLASKSLGFLGT